MIAPAQAPAQAPLPVTVVIPTRNEEKNLEACLERLSNFERVIVLDSRSSDRTREIALSRGAEVISFSWNGSFPKKRNWFLMNCPIKTPWVFFLDADELVTDEFKRELAQVLPNTTFNGFGITYRNFFCGSYLRFGEPLRKVALFRVGFGLYERVDDCRWSSLDMEVHEHPVIDGKVGRICSPILHREIKSIDAYLAKHAEYANWEAKRYASFWKGLEKTSIGSGIRQKVKYILLSSWILGPLYFLYCYVGRLGFLDGKAGLTFAICKMMYHFEIKIKIDELFRPADRSAGLPADLRETQ